MKVLPVLFLVVPAMGFFLGIVREPDLSASIEPDPAAMPSPPSLVHPGLNLSVARQRLAGVGIRTFEPVLASGSDEALPVFGETEPFVEPAPDYAEPPPPPPIDIASSFSNALTAVVRGPEGPTLLLVEASDPAGRRALRRGEGYADGWRVQEINAAEVVLRKGESERRIPIMQGRRPTPIMLAPPVEQATFAAAPPEFGDESAVPSEMAAPLEDTGLPRADDGGALQPVEDGPSRPRRRLGRPGRQ